VLGHGQPVGEDHPKGGPRGYDGGKTVKGRKRHLLVDTQGLVIKAKVHPADLHDKEGAKLLLTPLAGKLPRMAKVCIADGCKFILPSTRWVQDSSDKSSCEPTCAHLLNGSLLR
jgi:putative transposase